MVRHDLEWLIMAYYYKFIITLKISGFCGGKGTSHVIPADSKKYDRQNRQTLDSKQRQAGYFSRLAFNFYFADVIIRNIMIVINLIISNAVKVKNNLATKVFIFESVQSIQYFGAREKNKARIKLIIHSTTNILKPPAICFMSNILMQVYFIVNN